MKLSALFMALTMAVGLMVTPAAASDGVSGVVQDFFEWSVNAQRETGDAFWRAIYGDSWNPDGGFTDGAGADRAELVEKYGSYTDTMQADIGTTVLTPEGFRFYFTYDDTGVEATNLNTTDLTVGQHVTVIGNRAAAGTKTMFRFGFNGNGVDKFTAPFNGTYTKQTFFIANFDVDSSSGVTPVGPTYVDAGTIVYSDTSTIFSPSGVAGSSIGVEFEKYIDFVPDGSLSNLISLDVTEPSRAGSVAGDVYVVNENGEETVYNDYSVVNETTNIYNDPISGTERPMEDWAYDYIERQYNITLEDGANVTIKYGDENIEIVEGDSIETLNYGSGSSGEGGGDGDGGGTGIGDAIANLFTVLGEIILGLITALINLATRALDAFKGLFDLFGQLVETVTGFFGGFTDFLAGVFPFLPEETFTIFNFGLILLVAATVFRKFLK